MASFAPTLYSILGTATLLVHLLLVIGVVWFFLARDSFPKVVLELLRTYGLWLAFAVAVACLFLSLLLAYGIGIPTCEYCWWQRIAMYGVIPVLGVAAWRNDRDVWRYTLPLLSFGFVVALAHHYLQMRPGGFIPCPAQPGAVSCATRYVFEYGYITLPMFALTGFTLMIIFVMMARKKHDGRTVWNLFGLK